MRLNEMQVNIENDRQEKLIAIDRHLQTTDEALLEWQEQNIKRFTSFKDKVQDCLKYIEADKQ